MHAPIGPIKPHEVELLDLLLLREKMPQLPDDLWYAEPNPHGGDPNLFFRSFNRRCVFLSDQRLCGIQQHLGLAFKPSICQLFPLVIVETPEGVVVSDSLECRMGYATLRAGGVGDLSSLRRLAESGIYRDRVGERVDLDGTQQVSYREYCALEARLLACCLEANGPFEARLVAVNGALMRELGVPAPEISAAAFESRFVALLGDFSRRCAEISPIAADPVDRHRWAEIASAVEAMLSWLDVTQYPRDDDAEQLLLRAFVQQVAGKQLIVETTLADGLARFNFKHLLVLGLAAFRATVMCRHRLTVHDLNDALVIVQLLGRNPDFLGFFAAEEQAIRLLFLECWQSPLAQTL